MMILKEHNISVRLPQERAVDTGITLVQNDKGVYKLNIRVFDGVYEIDYTEVEEATITFSKADGTVVQGNMQKTSNMLTYVLGTNEIAAPGKLLASIQLLGANERLTTARFLFRVEKDLITEDAVKSTSEFPILQRVKQDVEAIVPLLPEIEETIEKFPQIQGFFNTAQAAENQRISNEITRQSQESARQAKIIEIEERFQRLTSQQQHDAEVIDARDGETSLRARLDRDRAEFDSHMADYASLIDNPTMHRNIFRGKNLGTSLTTEQKTNIRNGTFKDLYLGDYWVIGGRTWRIVDFDYWYNCGDTAFTNHHLVIMPDNALYNTKMNATNTTEGGYIGSLMYTSGLNQAKALIASIFGDMVLTHREYLVNAVSNGKPSGGAWFDSSVELPNEIMMYGSYVFTPAADGQFNTQRRTIGNSQLALMQQVPRFIKTRQTYWLRDVVSATDFALVAYDGVTGFYDAVGSCGVRPVFPIG